MAKKMTVVELDLKVKASLDFINNKLYKLDGRVAGLEHDVTELKDEVITLINHIGGTPTDTPAPDPPVLTDYNDLSWFQMPIGNLDDISFQDELIANAFHVCFRSADRPNVRDWNYWRQNMPGLVARGREINIPKYAWLRLIGWQAGPVDQPDYGPYRKGQSTADIKI